MGRVGCLVLRAGGFEVVAYVVSAVLGFVRFAVLSVAVAVFFG